MEQKLITLPEHMSSHSVFSGIRDARSLVFYEYFVDHCLSFCPCLAIVLSRSAILRLMAFNYPFDIFQLFAHTPTHTHICTYIVLLVRADPFH